MQWSVPGGSPDDADGAAYAADIPVREEEEDRRDVRRDAEAAVPWIREGEASLPEEVRRRRALAAPCVSFRNWRVVGDDVLGEDRGCCSRCGGAVSSEGEGLRGCCTLESWSAVEEGPLQEVADRDVNIPMSDGDAQRDGTPRSGGNFRDDAMIDSRVAAAVGGDVPTEEEPSCRWIHEEDGVMMTPVEEGLRSSDDDSIGSDWAAGVRVRDGYDGEAGVANCSILGEAAAPGRNAEDSIPAEEVHENIHEEEEVHEDHTPEPAEDNHSYSIDDEDGDEDDEDPPPNFDDGDFRCPWRCCSVLGIFPRWVHREEEEARERWRRSLLRCYPDNSPPAVREAVGRVRHGSDGDDAVEEGRGDVLLRVRLPRGVGRFGANVGWDVASLIFRFFSRVAVCSNLLFLLQNEAAIFCLFSFLQNDSGERSGTFVYFRSQCNDRLGAPRSQCCLAILSVFLIYDRSLSH